MSAEPFVIMVKPAGPRCNARCRYCYYLEKAETLKSGGARRMSLSVLERLVKKAARAADGGTVSFVWHGGEPTLAGLDFFEKAVELEKKHITRGTRVVNNLQTNGLLLDDKWCRFLAENRFAVGISLDGSRAVHDQNRPDAGGKGTFQRVEAAIKRLSAVGAEPDLLCTVNSLSASRPAEVYEALKNTGCGWVQFIPVVIPGPDPCGLSVNAESYGKFLIEIFDRWSKNDLGRLDVQLFAETANMLAGGSAGLCTLAPTCGRAIVCEQDGSIYSCDHFVDREHLLGNIASQGLEAMLESPFQRAFGEEKRGGLGRKCLECPHLSLCRGGCPKDREEGVNILCGGLRAFFDHAVPVLKQMIDMSRSGLAPGLIMEKLKN